MEYTRQKLWERFQRRFNSERYISEADGLYCPMKLIQFIFGKKMDKCSKNDAKIFKSRHTDLKTDWFDCLKIQTIDGRQIEMKDVQSLKIQDDGSIVITTTNYKTLVADLEPIYKISDLWLSGIVESFIQSYRSCSEELKEIPNILIVLREMIPSFEVTTKSADVDMVIKELGDPKNEECLNLLLSMSNGILDDLELIFSKFTKSLNVARQ